MDGLLPVVGMTKRVDVKWLYVGGRKLTGENQIQVGGRH